MRLAKERKAFYIMLALRALYLILIIKNMVVGDWRSVAMDAPVFIVTLFLPLVGKKRFYMLDAYVIMVFCLAAISPSLGFSVYDAGILSIDKLFHFLGGFGLGWFGILLYKNDIGDPKRLFLTGLLVAIALGACWEVFEWILWQLPEPFKLLHGGLDDTILDLVADTLGAILAVSTIKR